MSESFLGEIRVVPFNFAPKGFAFCNGQLISYPQNTALFTLLGTTYGGDGISTFGLPDLRGRVPIHAGQGPGLSSRVLGQPGGVEAVTLTEQQIPPHQHSIIADAAAATTDSPTSGYLARGTKALYAAPSSLAQLTSVAGSTNPAQPHENRMPFLAVNFIICLSGIYPSQN